MFRFVALLVLPVAVLGGLEAGLRLAGYGYSPAFFVPQRIGSELKLVANDQFGLRFFPPDLARSPAPVVMSAAKPASVFRIFLFGESAALGDPRPAYGMGRYLEALLRSRFPEKKFEVVCVAMTAINSHAILPIARECARLDGDLWVIYMGNNEMVGPFGASTVFGPQAPPWRAVRASLWLQRARTGQLLTDWARRIRGRRAGKETWSGMRMFLENRLPPSDPRKERVYANFRKNLEDIVRAGVGAGVPIVVSTISSNLKDCPPFASVHGPAASPGALSDFKKLYQLGADVAGQGQWREAVLVFQEAAKLGPQFADAQFRLGQCFLHTTNFQAARDSFGRARDLDALPFRADSQLNAIIREVAKRSSARGVRLVNADEALAAGNPDFVPGLESFYEHVHLTFAGNYKLALALATQIEAALPPGPAPQVNPDWATAEDCEAALGLTDWNRYVIWEEVLWRLVEPPFVGQLDHGSRLRELWRRRLELKERLHPRTFIDARTVFEEATRKQPDDHWLHQNFAEFLEAAGDLPAATAEWGKVRDLLPHHHVAHFHVGRLLARQKQHAAAAEALRAALRLRPDLAEAHLELGQAAFHDGRLDEASRQYDKAQRLRPDDGRVPLRRADVLAAQGKRTEAIANLREAIRLRPSLFEAHYLLGVELAVDDRIAEAQSEFEEVIRLRPDHALAHLNLGVALARQRRLDDALLHFRETLRLDPQNQKAQQMIQTIEQMRR